MDQESFVKKLDGFGDLTDEQVMKELGFLINTPMTYENYILSFYGMFALMKKCGATNQDERFREAAYRRVVNMLEGEPDPTDSEAIRLQVDYAMSLLSHFMDPPVPEEYALQLKDAAEKFYRRAGKENGLVKKFMDRM